MENLDFDDMITRASRAIEEKIVYVPLTIWVRKETLADLRSVAEMNGQHVAHLISKMLDEHIGL